MSAKTDALSASLRAASARKAANVAAAKSRAAAWAAGDARQDEERQAEVAFLGVLDAIARLRATGRLGRYRRAAIAALWGER